MPFVKFRSPWIERGVRHAKGAVLEVSQDKAEMLVSQNRAVPIEDPNPQPVLSEAALNEAAVVDDVSGDGEEPMPAYKPGSMPKSGVKK